MSKSDAPAEKPTAMLQVSQNSKGDSSHCRIPDTGPSYDELPCDANSCGLSGRRVTIVHYGEETPADPNYRALRMGRLARWLTEEGCSVTRFAPSYSHLRMQQRECLSPVDSAEGSLRLIPTRSYSSSRGRQRFDFISDFCTGSAAAVRELPPSDLYIVGYPPPGIVTAIRRAAGSRAVVLADVRDLWPDALVSNKNAVLASVSRGIGKGLGQELRLATRVTGLSQHLVERAPSAKRTNPIPIGIGSDVRSTPESQRPVGALSAIFVGSFTSFFDFRSLFEGWGEFVDQLAPTLMTPKLTICGFGPLEREVELLAARSPGAVYAGRVPSDEVLDWVAGSDIGVVPIGSGHGTHMTNKVLEYLSVGTYAVHTLDSNAASSIEGLSMAVDGTVHGWTSAFQRVSQDLASIRGSRADRSHAANERFGRSAVGSMWLAEIASMLSSDPTG